VILIFFTAFCLPSDKVTDSDGLVFRSTTQ